jgi:hypothetical protein
MECLSDLNMATFLHGERDESQRFRVWQRL